MFAVRLMIPLKSISDAGCAFFASCVLFSLATVPAGAQAITPLPALLPASRPASTRFAPKSNAAPVFRVTAKGESVVPIVFPVLGGCRWSDTWGADRDGGARKHKGQDLPAPKLRPLLAAIDGVWYGHGIEGDDGTFATYYHINNDSPGTDDGKGGEEFATAPGIWNGVRVVAGQHVAYCGDSGNAENTGPHLHFELSIPAGGTINAAASLRVAQKVTSPRYPVAKPEFRPESGQLRIDGQIVGVKPAEGIVTVRVAAWHNAGGKTTPQLRPVRRRIQMPLSEWDAATGSEPVREGDFIAVIGKDPGKNGAFLGERMSTLRLNDSRTGKHRRNMPPSAYDSGGVYAAAGGDGKRIPPLPSPAPPSPTLFNFEFGVQPWALSGDCFGLSGVERSDYFRGRFAGWQGIYYLSTAHGQNDWIDRGRGKAVSPPFVLTGSRLRFLIGGGNYPDECYLRIVVDGTPILTATGFNSDRMQPVTCDVSAFRGKTAHIEIVDNRSVGPRGYLLVDHIEVLPDE